MSNHLLTLDLIFLFDINVSKVPKNPLSGITPSHAENIDLNKIVSDERIEKVLKQLKKKKAPGADSITNEMITYGYDIQANIKVSNHLLTLDLIFLFDINVSKVPKNPLSGIKGAFSCDCQYKLI